MLTRRWQLVVTAAFAVSALTADVAVARDAQAEGEHDPAAAGYFVVETPPAPAPGTDPADVGSIDAIVTALYDAISGPAGPRDWDRVRSLFLPDARMIPTGPRGPGGYDARDVEGYIRSANVYFTENGFFETEIARTIERYGNIAHVFSTYESRNKPGAEPFNRGINSLQLFFDGSRWWIVSIMWQAESAGVPLPPNYLPR